MAKANDFGVGLMHEFAITAAKAGWEPEDLANLAKDENKLRQMLAYAKGYAEIKTVQHIIDCDADPMILFNGWTVEEHKKGGQVAFDASKIALYVHDKQKNGKTIEGSKLRKELANQPVLNANVLDYLMRNSHLIPDEWKQDKQGNTRYIFFWGTIYRDSGGDLCVRYLCWGGGSWQTDNYWLGSGWNGFSPAAVSAS